MPAGIVDGTKRRGQEAGAAPTEACGNLLRKVKACCLTRHPPTRASGRWVCVNERALHRTKLPLCARSKLQHRGKTKSSSQLLLPSTPLLVVCHRTEGYVLRVLHACGQATNPYHETVSRYEIAFAGATRQRVVLASLVTAGNYTQLPLLLFHLQLSSPPLPLSSMKWSSFIHPAA